MKPIGKLAQNQVEIVEKSSHLIPPSEPHREDGAVLDDDGERRREDDLGHDEQEARPRVASHLSYHQFIQVP